MSVGLTETTAAIKLIEHVHKQGYLDRLITAARKKHKVLLLGTSGVGKTNFLNSLSEAIPKAIDIMNRTEIAQKQHVKIFKQPFIFIDTPGTRVTPKPPLGSDPGSYGR